MPLKSLSDLLQEYLAAATGNATDMGVDATFPQLSSVPGVTESTYRGGGSVTSPGAGVEIASVSSLGQGFYQVEIHAFIGGTTAAVDATNLRLEINDGATTQKDMIIVAVAGTTGASGVTKYRVNLNLSANSKIAVQTSGAGTASAIYSAVILATKLVYT